MSEGQAPHWEIEVTAEKITGPELMKDACSFTSGAESRMTLERVYRCEHSPLRTQIFVVRMFNIPTFVSVHFVRHKIGVEHFVKSNRDDRPGSEDKGRMTPVNHMMVLNAQTLIQMARKRLCYKAHPFTVSVMELIYQAVEQVDPVLAKFMVRECAYRHRCVELKPCGHWEKYKMVYLEMAEKAEK